MAASGCYFRSCQAVAERETGQALTAEQITAAVRALQASGAVLPNMKVENPDAVINDAFARLGQRIQLQRLVGETAVRPQATQSYRHNTE